MDPLPADKPADQPTAEAADQPAAQTADPTPDQTVQIKRNPLSVLSALPGPYKRLFPYVRPYIWRFVGGLFCGMLAGLVNGLYGLVIKHVSDQAFAGGAGGGSAATKAFHAGADAAAGGISIKAVVGTCALIPVVMLIRSALNFLNSYFVAWVSLRVLNDLRNAIFKSVVNQSMSFFNQAQSGQLFQNILYDTLEAQTALTTVSCDVIVQPVTILSAIVALFYLDWRFTLVSFILFPLCLVPIQYFGKRVRTQVAQQQTRTGNLLVVLTEALQGIRVVKALGREDFEHREFCEAGKAQFRIAIKMHQAMEIVGPMIEAISAMGAGLALVYCWLGGIKAGTFLGLIATLFMVYDPAKRLSKVHLMVQRAMVACNRIFATMNRECAVPDAPDAKLLVCPRGLIEFEDVTFRYRPNLPDALTNFNLRIEAGKTYALVGASGAGKSTVLSLILRFYDPETGSIRIDGQELRGVTQKSLRDHIAVVNQDTFLFHSSILENIRYGRLDATDEEVYEAAKLAFAHDFIMEQPGGYMTPIGDKGCNLSGGQQQRLAIARALLRNAPILLLDEATSALDSESEKKIQVALERLSQGRTVIAIAHRLSTVLKADQIVAMDHGVIKEMGTHAELFENGGHYRRLYDLQFTNHQQPDFAPAEPELVPA